jgi:hypothetical protein
MHRSGTSAVAGALNKAGVAFGSNFMPPNPSNPKGYYEDQVIVAIHDEILREVGSSWNSAGNAAPQEIALAFKKHKNKLKTYIGNHLTSNGLFAFKDPRTTKILPLWKEIFDELNISPCYLIVFRNPFSVISSLKKRNALNPLYSLLLWSKEYIESEKHTRGFNRSYISYEDFLSDPIRALKTAASQLNLASSLSWDKEEEIRSFVDPSLNKSAPTEHFRQYKFPPAVFDFYDLLKDLAKDASDPNSNTVTTKFDEFSSTLINELTLAALRSTSLGPKSSVIFQAFLDYGTGFSEEDSEMVVYVPSNKVQIKQTIYLKGKLERLRIDPANRVGKISKLKLKVAVDKNSIFDYSKADIFPKTTNLAKIAGGNSLVSLNDDPIIVLPIQPVEGKVLEIDASFSFSESAESLARYLQILKEDLNKAENSLSFKLGLLLTAPLRSISKLLFKKTWL